jgi:hypothetical protein
VVKDKRKVDRNARKVDTHSVRVRLEIRHRPGKRSGDADGFSQNPLQNETDLTDARTVHEASPVSSSLCLQD